jgi:hypothetical protein
MDNSARLRWKRLRDLVIAGSRGLGLTLPDRHAIAGIVAARSAPQTAQQIA